MADLSRIKNNVRKMLEQGAPETEIDAYIAGEGTTIEAIKAYNGGADNQFVQQDKTQPEQTPQRSMAGGALASATGITEGIPVVGPLLQRGSDFALSHIASAFGGGSAEDIQRGIEERRVVNQNNNPEARLAGNLVGGIGSMGAAGATAAGANALGLTGVNLGTKAAASGLSQGIISGADTLARGETDPNTVFNNTMMGVGLGSAIPVVGAGIKAGANAVGRKLQPVIGAVTNPTKEGSRRLGMAVARDKAANPNLVMNQLDDAVARQNNVPVINADRGGETTRALARSVSNQSPEARAVIEKTASDRFAGQATRAADFIRKIAGGNADDLAFQEASKKAARLVNDPAYRKAYSSPNARAVWSKPISELMQSQSFRKAVKGATKTGTNKAAISGVKAVTNPFVFLDDGSVTLKINKDGSRALPSLQFWDQVKVNLDDMIGVAQRKGKSIGDLVAMKQKLVGVLDQAVPEYATARGGAAAFFGADDALEAGKKYANATRALPEAKAAIAKMKPAELKAFQVGYGSEILDKIKDARFRANVIDQSFGSPAKRELFEAVFGKAKSAQLESYIRVENIVDKLRNTLGNSTTARQLVELGIGAGSGYVLSGNDWKGAIGGAALAKGARYLGTKADDKVMQEVARLLTSSDDALIKKAVTNASMSPAWLEAMRRLDTALAITARGTALTAVGQ